jgi:hypothetical protein
METVCFRGMGTGKAGEKKNRWKPACFQWFRSVRHGGRSRTRIYDLHDINGHERIDL